MASRWSLFYPSPILNMVSKKGIGGFIDPTMKIPPMLGYLFIYDFDKTNVRYGYVL